MSETTDHPLPPSLPWRFGSAATIGIIGLLTRVFMHGPNSQKAIGLNDFLNLVDDREDVTKRKRGLLTVSNHISVIDDPLIWGVLPLRYHFNPSNHRWSLASYDICFKNKALDHFFMFGQTLPTHRLRYSPYGGLFQPTMRETIRLLSKPPFRPPPPTQLSTPSRNIHHHTPDIADPFSSTNHTYTYSTNGIDTFPAPSAYDTRQYSWVHIFPEGKVHQHPEKTMRYFKWGVARLILEPDVCPDIVPMWVEGNDHIMHETRQWPRFLPRVGKRCGVWFGDNIGGEGNTVFHELRSRWQDLVQQSTKGTKSTEVVEMGVLNDELKYGEKAVALREECTRQIRRAVLDVRRRRGLPDEDPKEGLVDTWREEGEKVEGRMDDGSLVKDT